MTEFKENSMAAVFQNRVKEFGDRACVAYRKDGVYTDLSWNEMDEKVRACSHYLLSIGIKKNDKVAIFSPNRYEWWVADLAVLSIGAVTVPIYSTNSMEETLYILDKSQSKVCFAATSLHLEKVIKAKKKLTNLEQVVIFENPEKKRKDVTSFEDILSIEKKHEKPEVFDKKIASLKLTDIASLIYTSGTTGDPKGVILTNGNFISNIVNSLEHLTTDLMNKDNIFLSFLPLSHVLERTAGYYMPLYNGAKVAFAGSINTLMDDMKEICPTILVSVPRTFEKVHAAILNQIDDASIIKKIIFRWSMKQGFLNIPNLSNNRERTGFFSKKYNLAEKLVFSKLREKIGMNKVRTAFSAGAPLAVTDAEFFLGIGITVLEGYGLTETSPVISLNQLGKIKLGTVGHLIPNTEYKISDEGELWVKGPQIMKGYYRNTKATKEVLTSDGFFKTADQVMIDEDGFLSITGRIKDIIITAGGKNISPQVIEGKLKESRYIEQIAIIGDRRKYLTALIIPSFENLFKFAEKHGIEYIDTKDLLSNNVINEMIFRKIKKHTSEFGRVERIKKFTLLEGEWTQETKELTPSLKVKRRVIEEKYKDQIEKMYE